MYWVIKVWESIDMSIGHRDINLIMLKTAINISRKINPLPHGKNFRPVQNESICRRQIKDDPNGKICSG